MSTPTITKPPVLTEPLPDDYIDRIDYATASGQITWETARLLQDLAMPWCETHGLPSSVRDKHGAAMCVRCAEERRSGAQGHVGNVPGRGATDHD